MALFFITGAAGCGKSTICLALKSRGCVAYDTDEDGLSSWQHNQSGHIHPPTTINKEERTETFMQTHSWNASRQKLEKLAEQANDKAIFVCGVADNLEELLDVFTGVFVLVIDETTRKYRLETRTNSDMGRQPHELQYILKERDAMERLSKTNGFITIDATQPTKAIIDEILKHTNRKKSF